MSLDDLLEEGERLLEDGMYPDAQNKLNAYLSKIGPDEAGAAKGLQALITACHLNQQVSDYRVEKEQFQLLIFLVDWRCSASL